MGLWQEYRPGISPQVDTSWARKHIRIPVYADGPRQSANPFHGENKLMEEIKDKRCCCGKF